MLLRTLGAILLVNVLTGRGIIRTDSGNKKGKQIVRAGSENNEGKGTLRAGTGKKWDF